MVKDRVEPFYIGPIWRRNKRKTVFVLNDDLFPPPSEFDKKISDELKRVLEKSDKDVNDRARAILGEWSAGQAPRKIMLNEILTDQITRIGEFTDVTKLEFGALILKDRDGVKLDFIQIGEDRSVEIRPTRELLDDEYILGSYHQHPLTDRFSIQDFQSFLSNDWEEIMILRGAHKIILVAFKLTSTKVGAEMVEEDTKLDNKEIAEKYDFAIYRGSDPNNLQLLNTNMDSAQKTMTIDNIVKQLKGKKYIPWGVKKVKRARNPPKL